MWPPEVKRAAVEAWFSSGVETQSVWKGTQTLKFPGDLMVIQEIIYDTHPDVIVETGTWKGGSANFYGDLGVEVHSVDLASPKPPTQHPLVTYYRGYSTSPSVLYRIGQACQGKRVMVLLDSDHHKANVLAELAVYAPMVSQGCYLVVEDTLLGRWIWVDDFKDDGPADALDEWLPDHPEFVPDPTREKHGMTMNPGGFLVRQ